MEWTHVIGRDGMSYMQPTSLVRCEIYVRSSRSSCSPTTQFPTVVDEKYSDSNNIPQIRSELQKF